MAPTASQTAPQTILCVEDEQDILKILKLSIERVGGMRMHGCRDPRRALKVARLLHPDLIVLDVKMPRLDGRDVFRQLKADAATRGTPVVFLTASVERKEVDSLKKLGAEDVLFKPFDVRRLPGKLTRILRRCAKAAAAAAS